MEYYTQKSYYTANISREYFAKNGRSRSCGGSCPVCTNCRG